MRVLRGPGDSSCRTAIAAGLVLATLMLSSPAPRVLAMPATAATCPDPFSFLSPWITLDEGDRRRIDDGQSFVRVLPADGREVAVLAIVSVPFDGDRLVAWMHRIEALKQSSRVPVVGRFSDPPVPSDLDTLVLGEDDLEDLRACEPGDCGLKLTAAEIARLRQSLAGAEGDGGVAAQDAFRQIVLDRVRTYRKSGHPGIGGYADGRTDRPLESVASQLIGNSTYLVERTPALAEHLAEYPDAALPEAESFMYWSMERFDGRPVATATHVVITRPDRPTLPEVLVAGKQIFATHYQNGSLGLTMLLRGCPGGPNYLAYINRSEVDVIRGLMGWMARRLIEGRVEDQAGELLAGLRDRLSEPPPAPDRSRHPEDVSPHRRR